MKRHGWSLLTGGLALVLATVGFFAYRPREVAKAPASVPAPVSVAKPDPSRHAPGPSPATAAAAPSLPRSTYEAEFQTNLRGRLPASVREGVELRRARETRGRSGLVTTFEAYWDGIQIEGSRSLLLALDESGNGSEPSFGLDLSQFRAPHARFPTKPDEAGRGAIEDSLRGFSAQKTQIHFSHRSWFPVTREREIRPCLNYRVEYARKQGERDETWCVDAETGRVLKKTSRRKTF